MYNFPASPLDGDQVVLGGITYEYGSGRWFVLPSAALASSVSVDATPVNYTPASANVEAHLAAIDAVLGSLL
jgi:hypothetical protein